MANPSEFHDEFAAKLAEELQREYTSRFESRLVSRRRSKTVHLLVDPAIDDEIKSLAREMNVSKATIVRYFLRQGLAEANLHKPDFTSPTRALLGRDPVQTKTSLDVLPRHRPPSTFKPKAFGDTV